MNLRRRILGLTAALLATTGVGWAQVGSAQAESVQAEPAKMYTTQQVFSAFQQAQVFKKPGWKMSKEADLNRVTLDLQTAFRQQGPVPVNPRFVNALETTRFTVSYEQGEKETTYAGEIITFKSAADARNSQRLGRYNSISVVLSDSNFTVILTPLSPKSDLKPVVADMLRVYPNLK